MIVTWCAEVEEKYEGPRLEEEISADFMQEMMDWLRNQKLLHKKYAFKVSQKVSDQKIHSPDWSIWGHSIVCTIFADNTRSFETIPGSA